MKWCRKGKGGGEGTSEAREWKMEDGDIFKPHDKISQNN